MEQHVSISKGNVKMGAIPSVSLPAIITCSPEAYKCCGKKCYAYKIAKLRKTVDAAYQRNLEILKSDPDKFWREVNAAVAVTCFFRFGVSGDIYDKDYFENMVKTARNNKHCEILCFTKKFSIVNEYLEHHMDKFTQLLCKKVDIDYFVPDGIPVCNFSKLINDNIDLFKKHIKKHWVEGMQWVIEDDSGELEYEIIKEFDNVVGGRYGESVNKQYFETLSKCKE